MRFITLAPVGHIAKMVTIKVGIIYNLPFQLLLFWSILNVHCMVKRWWTRWPVLRFQGLYVDRRSLSTTNYGISLWWPTHSNYVLLGCMWVGCEEECYRFILRPHLCITFSIYVSYWKESVVGLDLALGIRLEYRLVNPPSPPLPNLGSKWPQNL